MIAWYSNPYSLGVDVYKKAPSFGAFYALEMKVTSRCRECKGRK
jgi:hypothetical protein